MTTSEGKDERARSEINRDLHEALDDLESFYWVPALRTPFAQLEQVEQGSVDDCRPLHGPFAALSTNLKAAAALLDFPYILLSPLVLAGTDMERRIVEERMSRGPGEFAVERDPAFAAELVAFVMKHSRRHLRGKAELDRLMHQACLLAWGAFETFCKEVFIAALNQRPSLYASLLKVPVLKERFAISQGGWPSLLEAHAYDLNGKLGTIVGADKEFSSPQLLCTLFPELFKELEGSDDFLEYFKNRNLWLLGHRRHLIAHRCGLVDDEYMRKTNDDTQRVGQVLRLRGRDMAQALGAVASCAISLYGKARYCWPRPPGPVETNAEV